MSGTNPIEIFIGLALEVLEDAVSTGHGDEEVRLTIERGKGDSGQIDSVATTVNTVLDDLTSGEWVRDDEADLEEGGEGEDEEFDSPRGAPLNGVSEPFALRLVKRLEEAQRRIGNYESDNLALAQQVADLREQVAALTGDSTDA